MLGRSLCMLIRHSPASPRSFDTSDRRLDAATRSPSYSPQPVSSPPQGPWERLSNSQSLHNLLARLRQTPSRILPCILPLHLCLHGTYPPLDTWFTYGQTVPLPVRCMEHRKMQCLYCRTICWAILKRRTNMGRSQPFLEYGLDQRC